MEQIHIPFPIKNSLIECSILDKNLGKRFSLQRRTGGMLSYVIELVTTYILFLHIICIDTIHEYQPYSDCGVG